MIGFTVEHSALHLSQRTFCVAGYVSRHLCYRVMEDDTDWCPSSIPQVKYQESCGTGAIATQVMVTMVTVTIAQVAISVMVYLAPGVTVQRSSRNLRRLFGHFTSCT